MTKFYSFLFLLICNNLTINAQVNSWNEINTGGNSSYAIAADGTLWAWGYNAEGQLGQGDLIDRNVPTQVGTDNDWKQVAGGGLHVLALKQDGTMWACGSNYSGECGIGNNVAQSSFVQVGSSTDWNFIEAGNGFSFGIKYDGTLWAWGNNTDGQLGLGHYNHESLPVQVGTNNDFYLVSAGFSHTLASKVNGTLWAWGSNISGQCGLGPLATNVTIPTQVGSSGGWYQISAGYYHSLGIQNSYLHTWGANFYGQLGTGNLVDGFTPTQIGFNQYQGISGGGYHSLALKTDFVSGKSTLWSCGLNSSGQLGIGSNVDTNLFVQVGTDNTWLGISAGHRHTLAKKSLWAWGADGAGQLGLGSATAINTPQQVLTAIPFSLKNIQLKVVSTDQEVFLDWQTKGLTTGDQFDIQRSRDGINFETIARNVNGNNYTDKSDKSSILWYRILLTDENKINSNTEIINLVHSKSLLAYPNPCNNELNCIINGDEEEMVKIQLLDMAGRRLYTTQEKITTGSNQVSINTSRLLHGNYIIQVSHGKNKIEILEFVKN